MTIQLRKRSFIDTKAEFPALAFVRSRLMLGAMVLATLGHSGARSAAQDPPSVYPVDGVVLDTVTHQPIARALVNCPIDGVLTDGEGRFELHLPAGTNWVSVRRPGYLGFDNGPAGGTTAVEVREKTPSLTLYLTPSATILGHVTLSSGDQSGGLQFVLYKKSFSEGSAQWVNMGMAVTGSDGEFLFPSLDVPGSYVLCNSASTDASDDSGQQVVITGYPGACYPGGADLYTAIASPLTLVPGQKAQLEISLSQKPFYPVSIAVASNLTNGLFPQIFDRSGSPVASRTRRNEQTESIETTLPNGSYYAEVRTWGTVMLYGRTNFTVAGGPFAGVTVVPSPVRPIVVEVHREFTMSGQQENQFSINGDGIIRPGIGMNLRAADKPFEGMMGANLRTPQGAADGDVYELEPPSQGSYWVEVQVFGRGVYVSAMTSGNTDLFREPLMVGAGLSAAPIEITLRNDVGFLNCKGRAPTAADADSKQAISSVLSVYAIPQFPSQSRIYQTIVQPSESAFVLGHRSFPLPLPPGSYLVVTFDHPHSIDLDDKEEMSRLATQGQTVTIAPGATTESQVEPILSSVPGAVQ